MLIVSKNLDEAAGVVTKSFVSYPLSIEYNGSTRGRKLTSERSKVLYNYLIVITIIARGII